MDALSALLSNAAPQANYFFSGNLCGSSSSDEHPGEGQLHLVRSGRLALYEQNSLTHTITEPTLIIFPSGKKHRLQSLTLEGCDIVCASLSFKDSPLYRALPSAIVIPLSKLPTLNSVVSLLFDEAFEPRYAQISVVSTLLELILLLLIRYLVDNKICQEGILAALSDPKLAKAIEVIHSQPDQPWTIESLAQHVGMSRARFAALFHQVIGQPPLRYLTESRLLLAQQLLLAGNPMKSVCLDVGYSSSVAFSRAFQRQFEQTPGQWLKQQ
ncbi:MULTISPECIES: AraC family transcriptional regulator [Vibrio]|uniref:AraC family transcriptional regulator n=1 Tax=Vibrio TaxID=662 RepID=UPI0005707A58|nr:AraC family transcriptional regulator [Vibrio pacinii]